MRSTVSERRECLVAHVFGFGSVSALRQKTNVIGVALDTSRCIAFPRIRPAFTSCRRASVVTIFSGRRARTIGVSDLRYSTWWPNSGRVAFERKNRMRWKSLASTNLPSKPGFLKAATIVCSAGRDAGWARLSARGFASRAKCHDEFLQRRNPPRLSRLGRLGTSSRRFEPADLRCRPNLWRLLCFFAPSTCGGVFRTQFPSQQAREDFRQQNLCDAPESSFSPSRWRGMSS